MPPARPHVVIVVADDMGYSDLGCFGGEVATPNLDRLGRAGARLTRFYNTTRCSPSRASLLTGLHPHQAGIGILTSDDRPDGYRGSLNERCLTIAEVLRGAGYAIAEITYDAWRARLLAALADGTSSNAALTLTDNFPEAYDDGVFRAEAIVDCRRTLAALDGVVACPPVTRETYARYVARTGRFVPRFGARET